MDVHLPDGRILRGVPDGTTKAQIAAKLNIHPETGQTQPNMKSSPAEEFQHEHPFIRTVGRAARAGVAGVSSLADLALLVPKSAALGIGLGAEKMGATNFGRSLQRVGLTPSMADTNREIVDQAAGGRLRPTGTIDKIGDFAGELIASAAPFAKGDEVVNALKSPGVGDAVKATLNPQGIFTNKYPNQKITSDVLKKQAGAAYKAVEESGAVFPSSFTDDFLEKASGVKPKTLAGQLTTGTDAADSLLERWAPLSGKPLNINDIQDMDEGLSQLIDGFWKNGRLEKEGKKLFDIQSSLREMVDNTEAGGALSEARKLWSKSARMKDIERIITRSEQSDNPATAIKTGFRTLYNNPNRIKGFSTAEREAVKKVADGGPLNDVLKTFGSRLLALAGAVKGGPAGAAVSYAGTKVLRDAATNTQLSKANKVAELIAGGANKTGPLLTNQGALATIGATNAGGQKLLPKPAYLPAPSNPYTSAMAAELMRGR